MNATLDTTEDERLAHFRQQVLRDINFMFDCMERIRQRRGRKVREIAKLKAKLGLPIENASRHKLVLNQVRKSVSRLGYKIPDALVIEVVNWLFSDSERIQREEARKGEGE